MSAMSAVRAAVRTAAPGTLFGSTDFAVGSRAAVESALSRLAKAGELHRIRRGMYFRPSVSRFGGGGVSAVAAALRLAADKAAGPSGAAAAAMLGLSTQMPAVPEIAVVGRPPTAIDGVRFRERSNAKRILVNLRPKEVAILELARDDFAPAEIPFDDIKTHLKTLLAAGEIDSTKIKDAAAGEPRAVRKHIAELFAA